MSADKNKKNERNGKSSLLSALSGVVLPSAADLCTRCPTRISMEHAGDIGEGVRCTVHITWRLDDSASSAAAAAALQKYARPEACEFADLTDRIRELQQKVLDLDPAAKSGERGISRSVIEVHLKGSRYANLTVTDLPGIVKTTGEKDNKNIITQINQLLDEYLVNERCIVLAVHPANQDFHNSEIFERAKKYDPNTVRTFPVVTKADKVAKGEESAVIQLVNGHDMKFSLGFHLVKLRSQEEVDRGDNFTGIIASEMSWFRGSLFSEFYRSRLSANHPSFVEERDFGVENLKQRLAKLYIKHLQTNIEGVISDIKARLAECEKDVAALGPDVATPSQRARVVTDLISRIEISLSNFLSGAVAVSSAATETPREANGTPLLTIRAVLEHQKRVFQLAIVPKSFKDFAVGDTVHKVIDGTLVPCIIVALKTTARTTAAVGDEDDDRGPSLLYGLVKSDGSWDWAIVSALLGDKVSQNEAKAYTQQSDIRSWVKIHPESGECINEFSDQTFQKIRWIPATELHRCYKSIADEIKSNRQRAMCIFEGEPVFVHHVRKWVRNEVRTATDALLNDFRELVAGNVKAALAEDRQHELRLFTGLGTAVADASGSAVEQWFDFLKAKVDAFLEQELHPQTHNHYFSTTILKLRYRLVEEMILSKKQTLAGNGYNGEFVSVSAIQNVFSGETASKDLIEFVAQEVSVALQAYFKVARKNIVDGMAKLLDASLQQSLLVRAEHVGSSSSMLADRPLRHQLACAAIAGSGQCLASVVRAELDAAKLEEYLEDEDAANERRRLEQELVGLRRTLDRLPKLKAALNKTR